jgi:hypothetical protein
MTKPTIEKTPTLDPVALLKEEKADYEKRRDQAQQQVNAAQMALNNASRKVVAYDAAAQACGVVLNKLSVQADTKQNAQEATPAQ